MPKQGAGGGALQARHVAVGDHVGLQRGEVFQKVRVAEADADDGLLALEQRVQDARALRGDADAVGRARTHAPVHRDDDHVGLLRALGRVLHLLVRRAVVEYERVSAPAQACQLRDEGVGDGETVFAVGDGEVEYARAGTQARPVLAPQELRVVADERDCVLGHLVGELQRFGA